MAKRRKDQNLFFLGAIITNDTVSTTITDSQVGGAAALTGDIIVIVDNEGVNTTDLSYEIEFKLR
jgi:hypothetical protein